LIDRTDDKIGQKSPFVTLKPGMYPQPVLSLSILVYIRTALQSQLVILFIKLSRAMSQANGIYGFFRNFRPPIV